MRDRVVCVKRKTYSAVYNVDTWYPKFNNSDTFCVLQRTNTVPNSTLRNGKLEVTTSSLTGVLSFGWLMQCPAVIALLQLAPLRFVIKLRCTQAKRALLRGFLIR